MKEENLDLVLMDYYIPDMNGTEVIEKIGRDLEIKKLKIALFTVVDPSYFSEEKQRKENLQDET